MTRRPQFRRTRPAPISLTDDDLAIIRLVADHRFRRTGDIIAHLSHRSPKKIRNRLRPLYDHGYLDRPLAQRDDHLAHGKQDLIHALGDAGAKLIAELDGTTAPKSNWTAKNRYVKRPHLKHTLRIADITAAVYRLPRRHPDLRLIPAAAILKTAPAPTRADPNPWHWPAQVRTEDGYRTVTLQPDFVFGLDVTRRRERYYYFVEVDRATEPVHRSNRKQSSIERKFDGYLAGWQARLHTTRYGIGNLRFAVTTTSRARIDTMLTALATTANGADTSMFYFADSTTLRTAADILDVPWINSAGQRVALLPLPQPAAQRICDPCL